MAFHRAIVFLTFLPALTSYGLEIDDQDHSDYKNHPCKRTCTADDEPRVCKYIFTVEQYATMSKACYDCPYNVSDCFRSHCIPADGASKVVYSVNRQVPGPTVEVCQNDVLEVEVRNHMLSESTTLHWHGIRQRRSPLMDGVPFVSQCPVLPGQSFIYNFTASDSGTFFYHSHIGFQASDGLIGALIVHKTSEMEKNEKFDVHAEHILVMNDWSHKSSTDNFVMMHHDRISESNPSTILVNGLGRRRVSSETNETVYTPTAEFVVEQGETYRFRVIHAGFDDCPVRMIIDKHEMKVTSLDGNDVEPVTVDAMTMWSGERVDFLLKADQEPSVYLIRFKGSLACRDFGQQVAVLRYASCADTILRKSSEHSLLEQEHVTRMLNPYNMGMESASPNNVVIPGLQSLTPVDSSLTQAVPDHQFYVAFDFYKIDNLDFQHPRHYSYESTARYNRSMSSVQLNYISMRMPRVPLVPQWTSIEDESFCSEESLANKTDCRAKHCRCTHVLKVALNSVVELVLVDRGAIVMTNHPFHLHGHSFRVVAEENLVGIVSVDQVKKLDKEGRIRRNLKNAPLKDTVKVPSGGYTIVRFFADNPGYWFFHCHVEQHSHAGMSLIFKVGEHEDFPPVPMDFPKC